MFTYFRDSFITKQDVYRWAEPIDEYKEGRSDRQYELYTHIIYNIYTYIYLINNTLSLRFAIYGLSLIAMCMRYEC